MDHDHERDHLVDHEHDHSAWNMVHGGGEHNTMTTSLQDI